VTPKVLQDMDASKRNRVVASASSLSGWKWADSVSIVGCGNPFKLGLFARQTFLLGLRRYVNNAGLIS
jgi:hypothetical protein